MSVNIDLSQVQSVFDSMRSTLVMLALKIRELDAAEAKAMAHMINESGNMCASLPQVIRDEISAALVNRKQ